MISNLPKIIQKSYIGFDNLFDEILRINHNEFSNYPPFDILKKGSFNYQVKLAVAGFNKDEIEIITYNDTLLIKGDKKQKSLQNVLHKGISLKPFEKKFSLDPLIEIIDAQLTDGILIINLFKKEPEIKSPKNIKINVT